MGSGGKKGKGSRKRVLGNKGQRVEGEQNLPPQNIPLLWLRFSSYFFEKQQTQEKL